MTPQQATVSEWVSRFLMVHQHNTSNCKPRKNITRHSWVCRLKLAFLSKHNTIRVAHEMLKLCTEYCANWIGLSSVLHSCQHSIGYMGNGFYSSKDPTNSIKVLKEQIVHRQIKHTIVGWLGFNGILSTQVAATISKHEHKTQQIPQSTIIWVD